MKILIINRFFCEFSAGESLSWNTYQYFKEQGHDVYFFATNKKPYYIENYEYSKYFPKDRFLFKEYIKNPISYYWDFEAMQKLELMLNDIKPDIVHINQPITMSIFKTLKKYNIPVVWTLHDSAIICGSSFKKGNKGYCNFDCKDGNYINCLIHKCKDNKIEPSIRKTLLGYINFVFNSYDCVNRFITPSIALKNILLQSKLNLPKEKITVLNNFIDVPKEYFSKTLSKHNYFLYVGRLVEEKGIQYILKAMAELPSDINLVIAGKGPYEYSLKKMVSEYKLKNVKFIGYVKQSEINHLYLNAIATIVPSICFEVFGMINIESFACKTPVIGHNIAGIPEIIDNNVNGFIVEPKNITQLKNCILQYWNNLDLAIQHGENAYNKAKNVYSKEIYFKNLSNLYKEVLQDEN